MIASTSGLPTSVQVVSIWPFPTGLFTFLNGAIFSYDCKYIILLEKVNALVLIDISNLNSLTYIDRYPTLGGEFLVKGKYKYKKYLFLADGLSGIKIFD